MVHSEQYRAGDPSGIDSGRTARQTPHQRSKDTCACASRRTMRSRSNSVMRKTRLCPTLTTGSTMWPLTKVRSRYSGLTTPTGQCGSPLDQQAIVPCCTGTRDYGGTPGLVTAGETVITQLIIGPVVTGLGVGDDLVNMILTDQLTNSPRTPLGFLYS